MTTPFRTPALLYFVQRLLTAPFPLTSAFQSYVYYLTTAKDNIRWCKSKSHTSTQKYGSTGPSCTEGSLTARTHGPGQEQPKPRRHYIDRPIVKAPYIDTHCHLFTTLQMMQEVVLFPLGLPYRISANPNTAETFRFVNTKTVSVCGKNVLLSNRHGFLVLTNQNLCQYLG